MAAQMAMSDLQNAIRLHQKAEYIKAESLYLDLLNVKPDENIHFFLGLLYSQIHQYDAAIHHLEIALAWRVNNADLFNALAISYQKKEKLNTAAILINIALQKKPTDKHFLNRQAKIYFQQGDYIDSIVIAKKCINIHRDFFPAYQSYVKALNKINKPRESLRIAKLALRNMGPQNEIKYLLAQCHFNLGNYAQSQNIFRQLVSENFNRFESLNNLGNIAKELGDYEESLKTYELAKSISKNNYIVDWNISLLNLMTGNFSAGLKDYESRLKSNKKRRLLDHIPTWKQESLEDKSILIASEQGIGDQILFSRNFDNIIDNAKKTFIQCDEQLQQLFKKTFPKSDVIKSNYIPKNVSYKIFSGSTMLLNPNLFKPNAHLSHLRHGNYPSNQGINIGLSWRGASTFREQKKRATHLRDWEKLLSNDNFKFHNLQHDITEGEKKLIHRKSLNFNYGFNQFHDMDSLSQYIKNLDLVISVTNTNVHLSGSMGIPTWCLVPEFPDWHWGINEEQCRWYSSVTLYRNAESNWQLLISKIIRDLNTLISDTKKPN